MPQLCMTMIEHLIIRLLLGIISINNDSMKSVSISQTYMTFLQKLLKAMVLLIYR